jgi:hypothetical protein
MNQNQTTPLVEIPIAGQAGLAWNQLHDEREEICRRVCARLMTSLID